MLYRIQKISLLAHLYAPLVLNRLIPLTALAMWAFDR